MPRDTTTIDLEAERERLLDSRDDLVERAANAEPNSEDEQALRQLGSRIEEYIGVVEHLLATLDEGEAIVLAELTSGEQSEYLDAVEQAQRQAAETQIGGITPGSGTRRNYHVAACLVESPWTDDQGLQAKVQAIAGDDGPPPDVVDWLEHKATELNSLDEGNSKSFGARVRERRSQSGSE